MATPGVFTPYSTVSSYTSAFPAWVPTIEQERIASYQVYEEIYWNHPTTFKLVARGTEDKPIYVPSGRIITDTMNRYLCKGLSFLVEPAAGTNPGTETDLANQWMKDFFTREMVRTKFASAKLFGVMRGDWLFHVTADPLKPEGSRISINAVDPATYFPVYADDDLDRLVKVHLAEEYVDSEGKAWIKRQTYEKVEGRIVSSCGIFDTEPAKWSGVLRPTIVVTPPTLLDQRITAIPVYHIKNFDQPGNPYGSSEMRGLERIMAAINQSMSDEDIALALEGLGVYATDGQGPVDEETGEPVPWIIGPGRVVEGAANFKRIQGVGSVTPYTDHIGTLWDFMKQASATPNSAIGRVDVQAAESGIALLLEMGPILAKAESKQDYATDILEQLFYDLRSWFLVYEGLNLENTRIHPTFGDPLPQNKKAEVALLGDLVTSKIMSAQTARAHAARLGYTFDPKEAELIAAEGKAAAATLDPYAARIDSEAGAVTEAE